VSSKLLCWVALDCAAKLVHILGNAALQDTWRASAAEIKSDILDRGLTEQGVLRQHYDTDSLTPPRCSQRVSAFCPATTYGCATACWRSRTT